MKGPLSLIIFLLLAITVWWSITENYEEEQLHQAKSKSYVEIFMNEFEITTMNENGSPNYILNGSHLQRYNDSDETEVQQPVFNLLQENGQWKISADNAIINDKNDTIQLNDNVIMQQQNIEPAITIRTQRLLINTKTQIAQTQTQINITQGQSLLEAKGMIFNNLTSELELLSNVSGYYLPYD